MNNKLPCQQSTAVSLTATNNNKQEPLRECVATAVKEYFEHLDGHPATHLHQMLLAEVEPPLLKAALTHSNGNQTRAAEILGLNRATLRRKLKTYGIYP